MKLRFLSLVGLALAVCLATSSVAQDQPGGGRGGRGGQGGGGRGPGGPGGFGGGFGGGGASEVMGLLRMEEVRKEIELDDATYEAVQKAQEDIRGEMRNFRDMSEDERTAKMKEIEVKSQDLMDEVLEPGQQKRLLGLYAQQAGARAVMNSLVAKKIDLSEDGVKKAQDAMTKSMESIREKMRPADGERPDFTKMREMMQDAMKDASKAVEGTLTAAQKKALEELKGEKFEFPEQTFGGRGGPGGRPGGQGQGGGRPGGQRGARPGSGN